jgi:hypothetical protein
MVGKMETVCAESPRRVAAGGNDYDALFATVKFYRGEAASPCHRAIALTSAKFSPQFPGWAMYRRLLQGDCLLDRAIKAYFIGGARKLARARTKTNREYIGAATRASGHYTDKDGNVTHWIEQAALDALDYVIDGRYAEGLQERAQRFGIAHKTYQKIRDPLALGVRFGLDSWIAELHAVMAEIVNDSKLGIFGSVF